MVRERLLDLDAQSCQWQLRRWARAEGAPSGSWARILVMLMARPVGGLAHEAARTSAQRGGVGLGLDSVWRACRKVTLSATTAALGQEALSILAARWPIKFSAAQAQLPQLVLGDGAAC